MPETTNLPSPFTFEFGQARLKLKDSLRFTMRRNGHRVWYLVEDEISNKYFQIGPPQYTFLSMLDGSRTVNDALMKTASVSREHAIDETEAASLCQWAIQVGLVESELSGSRSRREKSAVEEIFKRSMGWLNPITLKIDLMQPDALLTSAERIFRGLLSPIGVLIWCVVVGYGFFQLAPNWNEFIRQRVSAFSSNDFVWLAGTWFVLKWFHEFAHSLVCKRFGGRIHACGILLLLLIPLPYVDVTSSWRFDNKWHRILTSAAGMLAEIFIAAIACCVWVTAEPGPIRYHSANVIIAATLHTLLFNANPLMRFDGYYIFSDWLEIPNLSGQGRKFVKSVFRRIYFNKPMQPISEIGPRGIVVRAYGFMALIWSTFIAISLILGASSLAEGIGFVLAVIGASLWFGIPFYRLVRDVVKGSEYETVNRVWFASAILFSCVLVSGFFYLCPSPSVVSAPIVIDYEPYSTVRAQAAGFANEIHVANGDLVSQDQLLVTLDNPELKSEFETLRIDTRISRLRLDAMLTSGEIAAMQVEQQNLASMKQRQVELETLISKLQIRAPQDGTVLAMDLDSHQGIYFRPGDEILSIGTPGQTQAIALARQRDVEWLERTPNESVELLVWGHKNDAFHGVISRINPRARDDMPHETFAASNGGALAVVPRSQVEGATAGQADSLMLTAPRVPVEISLLGKDREALLAGQTGMMFVRSRDANMGSYLFARAKRFISDKTRISHGL